MRVGEIAQIPLFHPNEPHKEDTYTDSPIKKKQHQTNEKANDLSATEYEDKASLGCSQVRISCLIS
jgi:hypothetical protein